MDYWKELAKHIKIVLMDCDGVLTDTGMYYGPDGDLLKRFCTQDGMGIKLLQKAGIKSGILTGEGQPSITHRANKLQMEYVYLSCSNKLQAAHEICKKEDFSLHEIAFIGDDVNDMELLQQVGLAACPANARPHVKAIRNIMQIEASGGFGAVRELCDFILESRGFELHDLHLSDSQ